VAKRPDFILPLCLLGFSGLLFVILSIASPKAAANGLRKSGHFLALCSICIASLCFWFLTAPDPRFLGSDLRISAVVSFGDRLGIDGRQSRIFADRGRSNSLTWIRD
jgi:hypothetical protein